MLKHSILILLLQSLLKKEKGFCYVDTHAGRGVYDLSSLEANKTEEYKQGIARVYRNSNLKELQDYFSIIEKLNKKGGNLYPGSPYLAQSLLRSQDDIILNELHPKECEALRCVFSSNKQVAIHQRNAYEFLPGILPPHLRRGLILIDPPFEKKEELQDIEHALHKAFRKWPQGIYMIWLPLKEKSLDDFYHHLKKYPCERKFTLEFTWQAPIEKSNALQGTAIVILNLPWQLEDSIQTLMKELAEIWKSSQAKYRAQFF